MTDLNEMLPLLKSWLYVGLFSVIVIALCLCAYPLIPTDPMWTLHRYIVSRTCTAAFANIVLPGVAIAVDVVTPGGSFLAHVPAAKYGPSLVTSALFLSVALMACYV